ncbi:MAG: HlyD family type I secretion periplasmic adaptor subunit [Roseitalea porphyridii]
MWDRTIAAYEKVRSALELDRQRPKIVRNDDELSFLPAAIEILERPASPVARLTGFVLILVFVTAIGWGYFSKIDVVAIAPGIVVPSSKVKPIQAVRLGKVTEIFVTDGQFVRSGEPLLKLDPTETEVDLGQVARNLEEAKSNSLRYHVILSALDGQNNHSEGRLQELLPKDRQRVVVELEAFRGRLLQYDKKRDLLNVEGKAIAAETEKMQVILPLMREREEALLGLYEQGISPKNQWLQQKIRMVELEQQLQLNDIRSLKNDEELSEIELDRSQMVRDYRQDIMEKLAEAAIRQDQAELEMRKMRSLDSYSILRAPVDGRVQQLSVFGVGTVVQPAQQLMVVVPEDDSLELEILIENKDIGHIRVGQSVEVKLDSFPFTKFGVLEGTVSYVANQSVGQENGGMVFPARILLASAATDTMNHSIQLVAGMSAIAEIKTSKRRAISFFLDPILKTTSTALEVR